MTEFGDRLAALTIRTPSPDGHFTLTLRGRGSPTMTFTDEQSIDEYSSAKKLASRINTALQQTMEARSQGRKHIVEHYSHLEVRDGAEGDPELRAFDSERSELVGYGVSRSDVVDVGTFGLRTWDVDIVPEAFETFQPEALCAEVNSAIKSAIADYAAQVRALRRKYFADVGAVGNVRGGVRQGRLSRLSNAARFRWTRM